VLTNTTRLAKTHATVRLFIISIDHPETPTHATLLNRKEITYNSYKVELCPSPTGGVLVLYGNGLVLIRLVCVPPMSMRISGMEMLFNCSWVYKLAQ
jgi:hypothetical protein